MDYSVEDSYWRKFGRRQGLDDWDFYQEKYDFYEACHRYYSRGVAVDWKSGPLKDLSSYTHSNSYFRINQSLDEHEWQFIMGILARMDVSQIEHMELELPYTPLYPKEALGMDHLRHALTSGQFLKLKSLRIKATKPDFPAFLSLGQEGSAELANALRYSEFPNLLTLSLPACDVSVILGALKVRHIAQMRSFSIMNGNILQKSESLSQNLEAVLKSGCFESLQHLDLSYGVLDDVDCWHGFISGLEYGMVPNLTSLRLSENSGVDLADLVPFLLIHPLENLIMDGCGINSLDVEHLTEAILHWVWSPLTLKRLDLHNNELDHRAVPAFVSLLDSGNLAQLRELDLSENSGMDSRALVTLTETIQRSHHPNLKLLIWARSRVDDPAAAEAFVRLYDEYEVVTDEWYQVLCRFPEVPEPFRLLQLSAPQYSVKRFQLKDMKEHKVDWGRDLPQYLPGSESDTRFRMDDFEDVVSKRFSAVKSLRFRIMAKKSDDPAAFGQAQEGSPRLAAALVDGQFTSLLTSSLPVGDVSICVPMISLSAYDFSAILRAWNENHTSHLRAFSIMTTEDLDHLSRISVYHTLDAALKGGRFKSLEHLELSHGVLNGVDACNVFTQAIKSGNLPSITSLRLSKNAFSDKGPLFRVDLHQSLMIMDGYWTNSEQVWGLADAILNSLMRTGFSLEELEFCNGVLDGDTAWKIFTRAIKSGKFPNIRSLRLSQNALHRIKLEDLVPLVLLNSFETLLMNGCWITSEQVWGLADALLNSAGKRLALKKLDLHNNQLENKAVHALVSLAYSDLLPQLQTLNLGMNVGIGLTALKSLTEIMQSGHLYNLEPLVWLGNLVDDVAAGAIVRAYHENENLTTIFDIDWNRVRDPALKTMMKGYRAQNIRLRVLKKEHKEVLEDLVPLTCAKIFLCGFHGVGKTTLRNSLTHCTPQTPSLKEAPTRGIELSQLEEKNLTLTLWDIAGQEEYRVLHGTFFADLGLASGKATIFVLVLRARFSKAMADVEKDLLYWFRFIASSCQKYVHRHVVIVLNCFGGQQCTQAHMTLWIALIEKFEELFRDLLHICLVPYSLDVRFPSSVQPLKDWLLGHAGVLLKNVRVPRVCFELQQELKRWPRGDRNGHLPIMSWETFEKHIQLKKKESQISGTNLKGATLYLHEIGAIIYFDQKESRDSGSKSRSVVVLHPEWFCRQLVGELLLPEGMLEEGCSLIVNVDGLIPTYRFQCYFQHLLVEGTHSDDIISMLERVGLCYRKGSDEIMVPALIQKDDYNLMPDWEREGFHLVIGRSLATEDHERTAIPITLFRRLQVELAEDLNFGGRGDSEYRAGKSFSSLKVGELSVLIQFDPDPSNPNDDRIDILVKLWIRQVIARHKFNVFVRLCRNCKFCVVHVALD
ncbi:unnamed protein product [Calypogeia fissa]